MIRRLRWKIVAINMAMVTAVLLAVFVGVLVSSRAAVERTVNQRLMQVVQTGRYDASLPGEGSAAPCFVADVYPSGTVRLSGSSYYRLDDQDAMAEIVTACLEQGDSSGILRSYHLRYLRADGPLYTRIAFTDAAQEDATLRAVVKMSCWWGRRPWRCCWGAAICWRDWPPGRWPGPWTSSGGFLPTRPTS